MGNTEQFVCKKCGADINIALKSWPDRLECRVREGRVYSSRHQIEIQCKKCRKAVAVLSLTAV